MIIIIIFIAMMKITMMIYVDVDDDITDTVTYKSMNIKYKCFMYVHTVSDFD